MNDATEELFNQLVDTIKDFNPSLYETPRKLYINFKYENNVIFSIIPQQEYLLVTLDAPIEIFKKKDHLEDVREKGHWGVGSTRMRVKSEEDIWEVIECIDQMLKR